MKTILCGGMDDQERATCRSWEDGIDGNRFAYADGDGVQVNNDIV